MASPESQAFSKASKSPPKANKQEALNAFLVAADTLARKGETIEAELRFKQALTTAEKQFGVESEQSMLVLSILAAFYRHHQRAEEALTMECRLKAWNMKSASKEDDLAKEGTLKRHLIQKIRDKEAQGETKVTLRLKSMPLHIRKACQVLGISPDDTFTFQVVNQAWRRQMLDTSTHPDLGGNSDEAVILNKAKETLMEYFDFRQPKLGKKLGKTSEQLKK